MSQPSSLTPAQAWSELQSGNERFIAGSPRHPHQNAERRAELLHRQYPIATIFGCSDSRLAAEIIFDLGLGDAFVIRNVGQVNSPSVLGSIEYAVGVLQVPLFLVLGHDQCGAVRAAIDSEGPDAEPLPPHIATLIDRIRPAVRRVSSSSPETRIDRVDAGAVGREHLRDTVAEILASSEMVSDAVAAGTLGIVGANYQLEEGRAAPDLVLGIAQKE